MVNCLTTPTPDIYKSIMSQRTLIITDSWYLTKQLPITCNQGHDMSMPWQNLYIIYILYKTKHKAMHIIKLLRLRMFRLWVIMLYLCKSVTKSVGAPVQHHKEWWQRANTNIVPISYNYISALKSSNTIFSSKLGQGLFILFFQLERRLWKVFYKRSQI